jgi:hypothetical protein
MTSFFLAQASPALLDPGLLAIITATMTFVGLSCLTQVWWPPPRRPPVRKAAVDMAGRRAQLAVVKAGWVT